MTTTTTTTTTCVLRAPQTSPSLIRGGVGAAVCAAAAGRAGILEWTTGGRVEGFVELLFFCDGDGDTYGVPPSAPSFFPWRLHARHHRFSHRRRRRAPARGFLCAHENQPQQMF